MRWKIIPAIFIIAIDYSVSPYRVVDSKWRLKQMKLFLVLYYDIHVVGTIYADSRENSVKQMGARFGGQVGLSVKEAVQ